MESECALCLRGALLQKEAENGRYLERREGPREASIFLREITAFCLRAENKDAAEGNW